jgi:hypothetical protein
MASQSTAFLESTEESKPRRSRMRFALRGLLAGAIIGAASAGVEYLVLRRNLDDIALPSYLLVFPLVGLGLGWFGYRNEHAWRWLRPRAFFSDLPLPSEEAAERLDRTRRFMSTGFGVGIAVALLATPLEFTWRGWPFVFASLTGGMLLYPYFGMFIGYNVSLRPGGPKPSIRIFRFRVGTLMILVAYVAVLCGVGTLASRYSRLAAQYRAKALYASTVVDVFEGLLTTAQADVKRSEDAKELRTGRIPDGIEPGQKAFLTGLDGKSAEQYKEYRYGLFADGEDLQPKLSADIVSDVTRRIEICRRIIEKFTKDEQQPWVAVEPDPPMP